MPELDRMHCVVLKHIQKYPQGISTDMLEKTFDPKIGLSYILNDLLEQKYVYRLKSLDDYLRVSMGLGPVENTGKWKISDKGLAYLNNKADWLKNNVFNLINSIGVIAAIVISIISLLEK